MKLRADTAIGDFARITLTEHRDIVVVGKALDVFSLNSLGDRLVPELNLLDQKPWVMLLGVNESKRVHLRLESNKRLDNTCTRL